MGLLRLILLSSLMLISTLVASFAPLYLELSPRKVKLVSTYSTGLLVGAALTVVIPEGVEAVYEASSSDSHSHSHEEGPSGWIGASLLAGFVLMFIIDSVHSHEEPHPPNRNRSLSNPTPSLRHMPSHLAELEPLSPPRTSTDSPHPHPQDSSSSSDWTISMGSPTSPTHTQSQRYHREPPSPSSSSAFSTLLGLLLHSLSDGISLGASTLSATHSSESASSSLSSVIFLAIMLHKMPTAFALSNLLTAGANSSKAFIRRGLVLFSLAAPVGAIGTYLILKLILGGDAEEGLSFYTGITLVFSGGTFLFVATSHVTNGKTDGANEEVDERNKIGKLSRLGMVLAGMITPGILSKLVGHGH